MVSRYTYYANALLSSVSSGKCSSPKPPAAGATPKGAACHRPGGGPARRPRRPSARPSDQGRRWGHRPTGRHLRKPGTLSPTLRPKSRLRLSGHEVGGVPVPDQRGHSQCSLGTPHQHDLRLLRQLWDQLKKGDILLGDRAFGEYTTLAGLPPLGVDVVARLHQARKVDFRKARRLARHDGLFEWRQGRQQSHILSAAEWFLLPAEITVRIIRFTTTLRRFRARRVTLVTTLLDPKL